MGVTDEDATVGPERIREILSNWFNERQFTAVRFIENIKPDNDPYADDYTVAYEAAFEPSDPDKAH